MAVFGLHIPECSDEIIMHEWSSTELMKYWGDPFEDSSLWTEGSRVLQLEYMYMDSIGLCEIGKSDHNEYHNAAPLLFMSWQGASGWRPLYKKLNE
jgi:hypothetical protein